MIWAIAAVVFVVLLIAAGLSLQTDAKRAGEANVAAILARTAEQPLEGAATIPVAPQALVAEPEAVTVVGGITPDQLRAAFAEALAEHRRYPVRLTMGPIIGAMLLANLIAGLVGALLWAVTH